MRDEDDGDEDDKDNADTSYAEPHGGLSSVSVHQQVHLVLLSLSWCRLAAGEDADPSLAGVLALLG